MPTSQTQNLFANYSSDSFFCELTDQQFERDPGARKFLGRLKRSRLNALRRRNKAAEGELHNLGITFTLYVGDSTVDRVLPFDAIPRILSRDAWRDIEAGITQRIRAINLFLADIYSDQAILKDGVVPRDLVEGNSNYQPAMKDVSLPHGTYVQICGTDLVRGGDGRFYVLEDNCRTPSGVSYVVENRHLMMRAFPDLISGLNICSVSDYGAKLKQKLTEVAPAGIDNPSVVLLSPGMFNSAYFEHVFLAREMGVPLVEGRDLRVEDDRVYMRTVRGLEEVHVIYRRIDDDFLDPEVFRKDSMLGIPGLMRAYRAGNVNLANAVGTGVADDKAVYAYMPRIIRYYLSEDSLLENVHTYICREDDDRAYVLDHLDELVTKPVAASGGYGVVIGPKATKEELLALRKQIEENPENYIAQPMVDLSVCPTLTPEGLEPRHVDLRPFALTGSDTWVLPGGLTRVALRKGSLVVNSSQGGGSKDTWVFGGKE